MAKIIASIGATAEPFGSTADLMAAMLNKNLGQIDLEIVRGHLYAANLNAADLLRATGYSALPKDKPQPPLITEIFVATLCAAAESCGRQVVRQPGRWENQTVVHIAADDGTKARHRLSAGLAAGDLTTLFAG